LTGVLDCFLTGISYTSYSSLPFADYEPISSATFYRYIDQIERSILEIWKENIQELVQRLQHLPWFVVGGDGSWETRRNSNQGSYILECWDNGKILYQAIREKSIIDYQTDEIIYQGINEIFLFLMTKEITIPPLIQWKLKDSRKQ